MHRIALVLVVLSACHRPKHVDGHHPAPGVAPGELVHDDVAYWCDESERCTFGTVREQRSDRVHFYFPKEPLEAGYERRLDHVIPAKRLAPGDVVELASGDWAQITGLSRAGLAVGADTIPFKDVSIPTADADALDRHERFVTIVAGVVMTAFALGALILARKKQKLAAHLRSVERRHGDAGADAGDSPSDELSLLRCHNCNAPVPLVARAEVACPACGKPVAIPAAYLQLVESRRLVADALPREAAALRRARIVGHPAVGILLLVAAYGVYKSFGTVMHLVLGDVESSSAGLRIIAVQPLLYVPLGLIASGIGQLSGGRSLARAIPALAAGRDKSSFTCRGCGAPLGATREGVAELCMYCGVQNIIIARLASSAAHEKKVAGAIEVNIRSASAGFWSRFWRICVPPLYVVGAISIVLAPIVLAVGWAT